MPESEIDSAINNRFGVGNIENQLCNEACHLLWNYMNDGGSFDLREWYSIKKQLLERIVDEQ